MGLPELEVPAWEELYGMCLQLAEKIRESGISPDLIVGIARGGWPVGRVLSDLLGISKVANLRIEFYEEVGKRGREARITQPVSVDVKGKTVLLVDDVADTGISLKVAIEHLKERGAREVYVATLYYKPWSVVKPDFFIKETKKWVVFAWERYETYCNLKKRAMAEGMEEEEFEKYLREQGFPMELVPIFKKWSRK